MALTRVIGEFASREIRKSIGNNGVRNINVSGWTQEEGKGWIWDFLKNAVGWALKRLWENTLGRFNFVGLWDRVVSISQFVWNFDFAQTDAQLQARINALNEVLTVRSFGLAGRTLGTVLTSTIGIGGAFVVNEPLGWYLFKEAGSEILEDYVGELSAYMTQAFSIRSQITFYKKFIQARRIFKFLQPESFREFGRFAATFLGDVGLKYIEQSYQDEINKSSWSFAGETQKFIDTLPDRWQDRVEEFLEEFSDSVIETGYTIAGALDSFFYEQATLGLVEQLEGQERTIAVVPNRDVPDERIILHGTDAQLKTAVTTTLANYELLNNRDMGFQFATPNDEVPITENNGIELKFIFYNYEKPPYWTKERRVKLVKSEVYVPNCERSMIDWNKIKTIFGTGSTFSKGNIHASCDLSNGRRLKIICSTKQEGEKMLEKLASLSEAKIIYPINLNERQGSKLGNKEGKERDITPMFPAYMTIVNWNKLTKYEEYKKNAVLGNDADLKDPKKKIKKIELYFDKKPSYVDTLIQEALSNTL